jgi:hypothetical protein
LHLTEQHLEGPGLQDQSLEQVKAETQGLWTRTPTQGWVWDIAGAGRLLMGLRGTH